MSTELPLADAQEGPLLEPAVSTRDRVRVRALAPHATLTRHMIAAAQMGFSALLIHLSAGRIETHFHIFGSLAFLTFYLDWRVLITAAALTAVDHIARGLLVPMSIYGVATPTVAGTHWLGGL